MKNFAFAFALAFAFSSCLTVGRIQRNCDEFAKICISANTTTIETITRDTTIFRHDTIKIQLPADTIKITDTIRIENNRAYLPEVTKHFGLIGVKVSADNSILNVIAWINDSTFLYPHRDTLFFPDIFRQTNKTQTITVEKRHVPGFFRFTFWFFMASIAIALIWIGGHLIAFKFKLNKIR